MFWDIILFWGDIILLKLNLAINEKKKMKGALISIYVFFNRIEKHHNENYYVFLRH